LLIASRRLVKVSQFCADKILIADDEPSVRLLVKRLLSDNYIVLEASNGEEAVSVTRTEKPDLILMDILMPKMDGYTACYAIKTDEVTKGIPVVMLTAVAHKLNKQLSEAMDADGYITKPFSFQDLKDTISQFLPASKKI
jgi:CheY-like chemotaxis protein